MEQGEIISWSETEKIDRVGRANAQRYTTGYQPSATQDMGVSSVGHSGGYNSRIIHSKHAAVSQYDAPPHV